MAQTSEQLEAALVKVRAAIEAALVQSYSVSGRSVTRNLAELRKYEKDLERKLARVNGSGPVIISDFSNADSNTVSGRF
jgi:hypothetical protein